LATNARLTSAPWTLLVRESASTQAPARTNLLVSEMKYGLGWIIENSFQISREKSRRRINRIGLEKVSNEPMRM
jgi:hypothetical protein